MTDFGYIYCLSNPSYEKDLYKMGFTDNEPHIRQARLQTTGVPTPFKLEFAKRVKDYKKRESLVHKIFDKYRINEKREFFKIPLDEIKNIFNLIDGDDYVYKNNTIINTTNDKNNIVMIKRIDCILSMQLDYRYIFETKKILFTDAELELNNEELKYLLKKLDELPNNVQLVILNNHTTKDNVYRLMKPFNFECPSNSLKDVFELDHNQQFFLIN